MSKRDLVLLPDKKGRYLVCSGGTISDYGEGEPPIVADARTIPAAPATLRPGHVNAHTHLYSALVPFGMPRPPQEPSDFVEILEQIWWRLDRALDLETLRASARLYAAEALASGTTTLFDHHESPSCIEGSLDVLANACQEMGIRALLCYGATERNGGREEAQRGLAECRRFIESNTRPLIRGCVGLHASFTVSDETIREAGELCRELGAVLHVHLAEDGADVRDAKLRGYEGPLERLIALDALPEGSILAHGVHLSAAQVQLALDRGCWLVQNPRSNANNKVGYAANLGDHAKVGLGTDGFPANMSDEGRSFLVESLKQGISPARAAELANQRQEASRRLASERLGLNLTLESGGTADVIALGGSSRPAVYNTLGALGPRHVIVDGQVVVRDSTLLSADLDAIRREARVAAKLLWRRMEEL